MPYNFAPPLLHMDMGLLEIKRRNSEIKALEYELQKQGLRTRQKARATLTAHLTFGLNAGAEKINQ